MLRSILPIVGADPALAQALSQTGNRDIAMPRGLVPPALALLAGAGATRLLTADLGESAHLPATAADASTAMTAYSVLAANTERPFTGRLMVR